MGTSGCLKAARFKKEKKKKVSSNSSLCSAVVKSCITEQVFNDYILSVSALLRIFYSVHQVVFTENNIKVLKKDNHFGKKNRLNYNKVMPENRKGHKHLFHLHKMNSASSRISEIQDVIYMPLIEVDNFFLFPSKKISKQLPKFISKNTRTVW